MVASDLKQKICCWGNHTHEESVATYKRDLKPDDFQKLMDFVRWLDLHKVNGSGGAFALGHHLGPTGLQQTFRKKGVCLGFIQKHWLRKKSFCVKNRDSTGLIVEIENNSFFFNYCKGGWNANKILALEDKNGELKFGHHNIASIAVEYYKDLLGTEVEVDDVPPNLSLPQLREDQANSLCYRVGNFGHY